MKRKFALIAFIAFLVSAMLSPASANHEWDKNPTSGCVGTSGGVCPLGSHWDSH